MRISVMSFRELMGDQGEVGLLEFFRSGRAHMFPWPIIHGNKARKSWKMVVRGSTGPGGGEVCNLKHGADVSFDCPVFLQWRWSAELCFCGEVD